jgi:hypothetical protein
MRVQHEMPSDLAFQPALGGEGWQDQFDRCGGIADAVVEPLHLVGLVDGGDRHHRHQHVLVPDLGWVAREQRIDPVRLRARYDEIDPVAGDVDPRQVVHDLVDLRDDDAAAECGSFGDRGRVLGVRTGVEIAVAIGLVGDDERDLRRQVHQRARVEFEIGVDRADLEGLRRNEFGEPTALRSGVRKIQSVRDAAFEHGEMVGQRQDRLHHVQIVNPRRIHLRQGGGKKIGLLLIVTLDRHAVSRLDDRFEQLGRPLRGAEFSACAAHRSGPRQPRGAIRFAP